ncbi:hypothetical protein VTO42DRAFT_8120 [Malbranchea cinnamomea]
MRPTDNQINAGHPAAAEDERVLRKRKRDNVTAPSVVQKDGPSLDHSGGPHNAIPPSVPFNAEANKRVKFEETQNQAVIRIPLDKSELPGELWQHIFKFLPPHTLGRLLRVSKSFNRLLTPVQGELPPDRATPGVLKYVQPNSIWAASRKTFYPGMPRPLSSLSELQMWNLISGLTCQFCNKRGSSAHVLDAIPWEAGPGHDGVRVIWPFCVRACGECLEVQCQKEMDLLFSSTVPSLLVPAIPFAFFTPSMHYVTSSSLRGSQPPSGLTLTKLYLKRQIEEMKQKFEEVKSLGPAAAEEWVKGLEGIGKEKMADAARWEQWELTGGMRFLKTAPSRHHGQPDVGLHSYGFAQTVASNPATNGRPANSLQSHQAPGSGDMKPARPLSPHPPYHRGERSLREVNEAKASRKAEIERRCLELEPPLTANVLSHMDSFTAAIQIPHPFTDRDWEILKPRLLAQREVAERREQERIKQEKLLLAKSEERRQQEAQLREAKEALDREWEEVQKPIKERLGAYADEIIREGWRNGDGVTKEKCPKFAADVLIYVKDRFYADLAKEDAQARSEGRPIEEDVPGAPPKRKIILENMKWVFDTKIKPWTERFQKELFLCNGCENNTKFYGFEGVIQHYAAKHTSVLSLGSVVVHWRAEWPDTPPFHPNPNAARALMFAMPRPIMGQPQMYSNMYMHSPDPGHPLPPDVYPQPSPGPYSRTPYGTPYAYGTGPYRPPSPGASQFYPGQPPRGYGYPPPVQPPPPNHYGSPYPGPAYQPPPYPPPYGPPPQPYNAPPYGAGPNAARRGGPPPGGQGFGAYQAHIDEIAKNSRYLWNGTAGIKDLPHNVRAHVLIHHVVARFAEKFSHEPPLSLFADALNRHQQMKSIRNLSGLMCKSCSSRADHRRMRSQEQTRGGDKKLYTLPALVSHFLSIHGDPYDWKTGLLVLPEDDAVAALVNAPGMDDGKLKLLTAAFPWVFPPSHSSPSASDKAGAAKGDRTRPSGRDQTAEERHPKVKPDHPGHAGPGLEVAVDDFPRFVESPHADGRPLEPPRENEYDPHKPAFVEPPKDDKDRRSLPSGHRSSLPLHGKDRRSQTSSEAHPTQSRQSRNGAVEAETAAPVPASAAGHESRMDERPGSSLRNVSEDGEVAESHQPPPSQPNAEPRVEEMNAAERFLSSFDPGQDRGDYTAPSREADRTGKPRGRWLDAPEDGRRYHKELDYGAPPESTVASAKRSAATHSSSSRGFRDYAEVPPRHADDITPDPADPRHGKRSTAYAESSHPTRRPNNRFDRYEAQRQSSLRPRSRSPALPDPLAVEAAYYRERSPHRLRARQRPAYAGAASEPFPERVPVERVTYGRVPPPGQYHYVDDPRYAEPAYESIVDYVPSRAVAREPQGTSTYYIERPAHREMPPEYLDYEMEYQRQPVYEQSSQAYPPGNIPRDAQSMPRRPRYR